MNLSNEALDAILARLLEKCASPRREYLEIPIEASARHVHLTREAMDALFGKGSELQCKRALSQTGEFLSDRRVRIVTSSGEISNVAVLGPLRPSVQVELSKTDCRTLGVTAPIRLSGNLEGAADVYIIGDNGIYSAPGSVIVAKAHVHLRPQDAVRYGVTDGQRVSVKIQSGRSLTFDDVVIRVKDSFMPAFHVDFDEANACQLDKNSKAFIIKEAGSADTVVSAAVSLTKPVFDSVNIAEKEDAKEQLTGINTARIYATEVNTAEISTTNINTIEKNTIGQPVECNIGITRKTVEEDQIYTEKLVTEEKAIRLLNNMNGDRIRFKKGTLLTPSAKDIFARARKEVILIG